jgi:hypothetical protein
MNLQELVTKLRVIEEGNEIAPVHTDTPAEEEGIEIIGGPMSMPAPKQPDNVSMNVSLNGQGAGGVRDLMKILHDIESGVDTGHNNTDHDISHDLDHNDDSNEPLMGSMLKAMAAHEESPEMEEPEMEEEMGDDGETWENSAHGDAGAHIHGVDAVTATGDDMNSKGGASPLARAPGSNTMIHYHESLVNKLTAMYEEIKGDTIEEAVHKQDIPAAQRKAKGGDWKVTQKDIKDKESDNISSKEGLAKLKESTEFNDIITLTKMLKG